TGLLVQTGGIPVPDLKSIVEEHRARQRADRGRGDGGSRYDRGEGGPRYDRGEGRYPRSDYEGASRPVLSGPSSSPGILENPLTWIIVGAGIPITLEATGITNLTPKA